MALEAGREGLGRLAAVPLGAALEWFHGVGVIEVDDGVELVDESGAEVVAVALGLGAVDHADGALEAGVAQRGAGGQEPQSGARSLRRRCRGAAARSSRRAQVGPACVVVPRPSSTPR